MQLDNPSFLTSLRPILFDGDTCRITLEEINNILTNENLINRNSFHVVHDSCYENYDRSNSHMEEIHRIKMALDENKTVIIKDLELWGGPITEMCNALGKQVTAHMYISPKDGTSFGHHTDDTDVVICMLYGMKTFDRGPATMRQLITTGQMHYIPMDEIHKAVTIGWSCHISFGVPRIYLRDSTHSYPVQVRALSNLIPKEIKHSLPFKLGDYIIM